MGSLTSRRDIRAAELSLMHQRTPGARLGGGGAAGQRLVPGRGVGEEGSQHGGSGAPEHSEHLLLTAQRPVSQA